MDREDALRAYIAALLPERERALYGQALKKSRAITRGMTDAAKAEYLNSRAFGNTLWQVRKGDDTYQALKNGRLPEGCAAEFERLAPLIHSELERGEAIDLPFLRSVSRSRTPLHRARAALRALSEGAVEKQLEAQCDALLPEAERRLSRHLRHADLSKYAADDGPVVKRLIETHFKKGVPEALLDAAFAPDSPARTLRLELGRALPALRASQVLTPTGKTVGERVQSEVRRAKRTLCRRLGGRFPEGRLKALLNANASLKKIQSRSDAAQAGQRRLRSALLNAIPEHYRDLYPLARQMQPKGKWSRGVQFVYLVRVVSCYLRSHLGLQFPPVWFDGISS